MTDKDSTQSAAATLPISTRPLMDFNCLYTTRCKALDSLEIAPPSDWTVYGPTGALFEYPIQVVVLGIDGDQAKLAFYAHPSFIVKQGPPPDREWLEAWRSDPDFQVKPTNQEDRNNKATIKEPYHPLIMGEDCQNTDNCAEVLERVVAVFDLMSYLDFRHEEFNRTASDGLYYINSMLQDTLKYVEKRLESLSNKTSGKVPESHSE